MSIKVLEASAGSGKTYQLSMFYVKLALENPNNFKKILAITFTNAAVNEMKLRILDRLYSIANNNPSHLVSSSSSLQVSQSFRHPVSPSSSLPVLIISVFRSINEFVCLLKFISLFLQKYSINVY